METAVIIFGGEVSYRQRKGIEIFFEKEAKKIFLLGDRTFYFENCDKKYIDKLSDKKGEKVFSVDYSRSMSTYNDIINLKKIITSDKFDLYYIVTSNYHYCRVELLIKKLIPEFNNYEVVLVDSDYLCIKKIKELIKIIYCKIKYGL